MRHLLTSFAAALILALLPFGRSLNVAGDEPSPGDVPPPPSPAAGTADAEPRPESEHPAAADTEAGFAFDQYLLLPVRVHLLSAERLPEIDCTLEPEQAVEVIERAGAIWNQAGIQLYVESVRREEACRQDRFELAKKLGGVSLGLYRILCPEDTAAPDMLHVYFVRELPVNGVYLDNHVIFVRESPQLRPIELGTDFPPARVAAHEIGHSLSLDHQQDDLYLMSSGSSGIVLPRDDVEQARRFAQNLTWHETVFAAIDFVHDDLDAERLDEAEARLSALAHIPAHAALREEAHTRLEEVRRRRAAGAHADPS